MQNLFNFRLLHIKAFTEQYIRKYYSDEEVQSYREEVESVHGKWLEKVFAPVMYLLVEINPILKKYDASDYKKTDEIRSTINVLKKIYNS